ncbi:MAG: CDGSH iron-sulfur domain-containing protein [Chloroflexota bacterium]
MTQEERDSNEVRILVRNHGPLRVYGPVKLVDVEGKEYDIAPGEFFSLCRCGHSARKPFCDGTHKAEDFDAPSDATQAEWT